MDRWASPIQIMRNPEKQLGFPTFSAREVAKLRVPDINNPKTFRILSQCWEDTKTMEVPQYRDGECTVHQLLLLSVIGQSITQGIKT